MHIENTLALCENFKASGFIIQYLNHHYRVHWQDKLFNKSDFDWLHKYQAAQHNELSNIQW